MKNKIIYLLLGLSSISFSQESLSDVLNTYNSHSVPYITVHELAESETSALIMDAREFEEYAVSHLKDAIHIGYKDFNIANIHQKITNKNQEVVVYCSLGVRSEKIAEKLKKSGYTNVRNLYGGIFEWKNNNYDVYNRTHQTTDSIHAYSKSWSRYLKAGIKVYGTLQNENE